MIRIVYLFAFCIGSMLYGMDPNIINNVSKSLYNAYQESIKFAIENPDIYNLINNPEFNLEDNVELNIAANPQFNLDRYIAFRLQYDNPFLIPKNTIKQITNISAPPSQVTPALQTYSSENSNSSLASIPPSVAAQFKQMIAASQRNPKYNREYNFREYLDQCVDYNELWLLKHSYRIVKSDRELSAILAEKLSQLDESLKKSLQICEAFESNSVNAVLMLDLLKHKVLSRFHNELWKDSRNDLLNLICDKNGMIRCQRDCDTIETIKEFNNVYKATLKQWEFLKERDLAAQMFDSSPAPADKALPRFLNNPDNQNFLKIDNLCDKGDFQEAYEIVKSYEEKYYSQPHPSQHDLDAYSMAHDIYHTKFCATFDRYGIRKEYSSDPLCKTLRKDLPEESLVPNEKINALLAERATIYDAYKTFKEKLSLETPSPLEKKILYDFASAIIKEGPSAASNYLAQNLSADSPDIAVRTAYKTFYHENGLPKIFAYSDKKILEIKMPAIINTCGFAKERDMLFALATVSTEKNPKLKDYKLTAEQGIQFLQKACSKDELAPIYRSLAHSSYHALKQSDPIVLKHCTEQPQSQLQRRALSVIAKMYADVYNQDVVAVKGHDTLTRAIKSMDTLYGSALQGSEKSEKLLNSIVGTQEIILPLTKDQIAQGTAKAIVKTPTVEESVAFVLELEKCSQVVVEAQRLADRMQALEAYKNEGDVRTISVTALSNAAKTFLKDIGIAPSKLEIMQTNALQKEIQQELADFTEGYAQYYFKKYTKDAAILNGKLIDIGIEYVRENCIAQALIVSDCCNAILNDIKGVAKHLDYIERRALIYSKAFLHGVGDGVINTANYVIDHPIEAALTVVYPEIMIPYHIGKTTAHVLMIGYDHLSRVDYKTVNSDTIKAKFDDLYENARNISGPDLVRNVAALSTQLLLEGKAISVGSTASKKGLGVLLDKVQKIKNMPKPSLVIAGDIKLPISVACEVEEAKLAQNLSRDSNAVNKAKNNEAFKGGNSAEVKAPREIKTGIKLVDDAIATLDKINKTVGRDGIITNKIATEAAKILGFEKIGEMANGRAIFRKGNKYISADRDRHNGGFWKMADTVKELKTRVNRSGTYDIFLNKIGE